jgi:hypothetical protein
MRFLLVLILAGVLGGVAIAGERAETAARRSEDAAARAESAAQRAESAADRIEKAADRIERLLSERTAGRYRYDFDPGTKSFTREEVPAPSSK